MADLAISVVGICGALARDLWDRCQQLSVNDSRSEQLIVELTGKLSQLNVLWNVVSATPDPTENVTAIFGTTLVLFLRGINNST